MKCNFGQSFAFFRKKCFEKIHLPILDVPAIACKVAAGFMTSISTSLLLSRELESSWFERFRLRGGQAEVLEA